MAWVFVPFVLPICFYVAFTDLSRMRIPNHAVLALAGVFVVLGPLALPFDVYLWRLVHLAVMLAVGIVAHGAGLMGAGDAKFIAAAAPFIALEDGPLVLRIFAACLLAAFVAHRLAKHSALRRMAPGWTSWDQGKKFPMGLALAGTLAIYLMVRV